jgi:hypothetical protein
MKTADGRRPLARVAPALLAIAPVALVVATYAVAVRPRVDAADRARARVAVLHARLVGLEASARETPVSAVTSGEEGSQRDFERRTPVADRLSDILQTLARLADGGTEGDVRNLAIETGNRVGPSAPGPTGAAGIAGAQTESPDPRLALFQAPVTCTPVTVAFEATYAQLGRFFWNLRDLPTTVEVRSVDVVPTPAAPMLRVKLVLHVFRRAAGQAPASPAASGSVVDRAAVVGPPLVDLATDPQWIRNPFADVREARASESGPPAPAAEAVEPVVRTILFSTERRAALVDGRIVKVGDHVGEGLVAEIDRDAVVIETPAGERERLLLRPAATRATQ